MKTLMMMMSVLFSSSAFADYEAHCGKYQTPKSYRYKYSLTLGMNLPGDWNFYIDGEAPSAGKYTGSSKKNAGDETLQSFTVTYRYHTTVVDYVFKNFERDSAALVIYRYSADKKRPSEPTQTLSCVRYY